MPIQIDGMVSGLDTSAIIDAYVAVAGASTDSLRAQQNDLETRRSLLQNFTGDLEALQAAIEDFEDPASLRAMTVSTSDETVLTATAEAGATPGAFDIVVDQLARAELEMSQGYASRSDDVWTGGTLSVQVGTEDWVDIELTDAMSLADMAVAINEQVDGVSAYVLDDGGATDPYHLVIVADDTGTDSTIQIDGSGLLGGVVPTFTEQVSAQDAQITIANTAILSSDNTFEDVLPGVTFVAQDHGSARVTVAQDVETIVASVQGFVDAYNEVMSFIDTYTGVDADGEATALAGETVLRTVQTSLQSAMAGLYAAGDLQGTGALGLATQQDGSLTLNTTTLTDALNEHGEDVLSMFAGESGLFQAIDGRVDVIVDPDTGSISLRTDSLDEQIEDFEDQIEEDEARLDIYEDTLRQQFINMEMTLAELQSMGSFLTQLFAATVNQQSGS